MVRFPLDPLRQRGNDTGGAVRYRTPQRHRLPQSHSEAEAAGEHEEDAGRRYG